MFPFMKPLTPDDAASHALAAPAVPNREDMSLHDEILTRLRDHIVEGNIRDGGRVPERQLCEMLGISRTPLREAMREHEAILEALRRRAGSELGDVLFNHLRNKRRAAVEHLSAAGPAVSEPA